MELRRLLTLFAPALCLAQAQEIVSNQKILDELRSIRTSLERLEKVQRAVFALTRIQIDESQVTVLEGQRLKLSSQELEFSREITVANRIVNSPPPMIQSPDGTVQPAAMPELGAANARLAQNTSALKEVQRARQALEQEIARIKGRIAEMEKFIEASLATGNLEPPKR